MPFDRVYVGAGARRAQRDRLLRLLKPGGILVGPCQSGSGDAQRLLVATSRGGGAYSFRRGGAVSFTWLATSAPGARQLRLAGPVWGDHPKERFPAP